jgi:oxygen-independent coproporphyrinogen-3 oxidase
MAAKYELIELALSKLGLEWYEVSNWSRPGRECRHNILYWQSANWWGVGPGAHSHIGGVRWWNAKHPATWTKSLVENSSPAVGRDYVEESALEELMLTMRLRSGFEIPTEKQDVAQKLIDDGLIKITDRAVLTVRGRLLADLVLRKLLD